MSPTTTFSVPQKSVAVIISLFRDSGYHVRKTKGPGIEYEINALKNLHVPLQKKIVRKKTTKKKPEYTFEVEDITEEIFKGITPKEKKKLLKHMSDLDKIASHPDFGKRRYTYEDFLKA